MRFDTFEEFKADWREKEKLPRDPNIKVTCLCGQHDLTVVPLTDEELLDMYTIVTNVDSPELWSESLLTH